MAIVRLQHIGVAVRDLDEACRRLESLFGLKARDFRDNQGHGMQRDARVLLGNECWLHLVQNWDSESRVFKFLESHGEGLTHSARERRYSSRCRTCKGGRGRRIPETNF